MATTICKKCGAEIKDADALTNLFGDDLPPSDICNNCWVLGIMPVNEER